MGHQEIVFAGKDRIELQPLGPLPQLQAGEVRGRTLATLISPGTELAWAGGDTFPIRPGYASVFEVEEIGSDVRSIAVGDRRFSMGPHRSVQQVEAKYTLAVPAGMSAETALLARLLGVSGTTLMTTAARPGDRVVIGGAGPVGYLAAHQFALAGYDVIVVEPDAARRRLVEASGIAACPAMPVDDPEIVGTVALVVDCSGHEASVLGGCRLVRQGGEVVLVGVPWQRRTDAYAHELLELVFRNYVVLRSGWEWQIPILSRAFKWEELLEGYNNAPQSVFSGLAKALGWLAAGRIPHEGLTRTVSPADPAAIYRALRERRIDDLFVIFDWTQGRA